MTLVSENRYHSNASLPHFLTSHTTLNIWQKCLFWSNVFCVESLTGREWQIASCDPSPLIGYEYQSSIGIEEIGENWSRDPRPDWMWAFTWCNFPLTPSTYDIQVKWKSKNCIFIILLFLFRKGHITDAEREICAVVPRPYTHEKFAHFHSGEFNLQPSLDNQILLTTTNSWLQWRVIDT